MGVNVGTFGGKLTFPSPVFTASTARMNSQEDPINFTVALRNTFLQCSVFRRIFPSFKCIISRKNHNKICILQQC